MSCSCFPQGAADFLSFDELHSRTLTARAAVSISKPSRAGLAAAATTRTYRSISWLFFVFELAFFLIKRTSSRTSLRA